MYGKLLNPAGLFFFRTRATSSIKRLAPHFLRSAPILEQTRGTSHTGARGILRSRSAAFFPSARRAGRARDSRAFLPLPPFPRYGFFIRARVSAKTRVAPLMSGRQRAIGLTSPFPSRTPRSGLIDPRQISYTEINGSNRVSPSDTPAPQITRDSFIPRVYRLCRGLFQCGTREKPRDQHLAYKSV